jgi:hypothetical protein
MPYIQRAQATGNNDILSILDSSYKMKRYLFFLVACLPLAGSLTAQLYEQTALNRYKYVVVKPNNMHIDYIQPVQQLIETKLKERGFTSILDKSALYSAEYKPCDIVTCEFNVRNMSAASPEISTEVNFFDCNYTIVYSSKSIGKYSFYSEKNCLKQMVKTLTIFDQYTYSYQPRIEPVAVANPASDKRESETRPTKKDSSASMEGSYYALLIGISDYTDENIPDLDNLPVQDAEKLAAVLETRYTFDKENISVLKNPTRREIVIALDNIAKTVGHNDNVVIFYAGHGHYEEDNQIGYWLPKDSEIENTSNWLYNDQLVAGLKKIKSKHTLLISDACFSGSIFKSRSISMEGAGDALKKKYELPSRKAITSGTLKTVPNVSIFMKYLLDRLSNNFEPYFSASQLFQSIEIPVGNNSPTTPQYGVIQNVGDEGGDFIFIKKPE